MRFPQSEIAYSPFAYDAIGRLTSAVGTGTAAYNYTYSYGNGGNLGTRVNRTPTPDLTRTYAYDTVTAPKHYHAVETISGDGMTASFVYDANGNMRGFDNQKVSQLILKK